MVTNRQNNLGSTDVVSYEEFNAITESKILLSHLVISTRIDKVLGTNPEVIFKVIASVVKENIGIKVIFLSSVSVYGESLDPRNEESSLLANSTYGRSKILFEKFLINSVPSENLSILRIGNLFGLRKFDDVVNLFNRKIENHEFLNVPAVPIYRDFISEKYLSRFLVEQLESDFFLAGVINFASGVSITINDLVHLFELYYYRKIFTLENVEKPEIMHSFIDVSKLKAVSNLEVLDFHQTLFEYLGVLNSTTSRDYH